MMTVVVSPRAAFGFTVSEAKIDCMHFPTKVGSTSAGGKGRKTATSLSYAGTLAKTGYRIIGATLKGRSVLFAGFVASMGNTLST